MDEIYKDEYLQDYFSFLNLLKQNLPKSIKKGDRSGYEIEIRSIKYNPTTFKIDIFTFDQRSFNKCFEYNNKYINNSVLLITIFFKIKNLNNLNYIMFNLFAMY